MAAQDRDNAMSGLLRQSLQVDRGTQGECLSPDILAAYYERSLASDEMSRCEDHVSRCFGCREQLAALARTDPLPQEQPHRHVWLLDWRLLLSATAALLILTVWGVRRSAMTPAVPSQSLVAMSRAEQTYPQQDSLLLRQSPLSTPAAPPKVARESLPPRELNKVSPQLESPAPEPPRAMQKKLSPEVSLNAPGAENSLKLRSDQQIAQESNRPAETRAAETLDAEKSAAPSAPIPQRPTVVAQSAAPPSASNPRVSAGAGSVPSGADAGAAAEPPSAKQQSQSGAIFDRLGAANGLPAQSAEQRSAQTIIPTPNPKVLWRIAGGGFIERSQDGGATWHGQLPESNAHFTAGAAPATKVLWLVGENGMILLTKDASHWKKLSPPIPADFVSVEASSAASATVTAADRQKFSTSDSGKKWVPVH